MEDKGYPHYQYSVFVDKGGQYVVRADTLDDFKLKLGELKVMLDTPTPQQTIPVPPQGATDPSWIGQPKDFTREPVADTANMSCPIHNVQMKNGPYGHYHIMGTKPDGKPIYCKGR